MDKNAEKRAIYDQLKSLNIGEAVELPSLMPILSDQPVFGKVTALNLGSAHEITFELSWHDVYFGTVQIKRYGNGEVVFLEKS